MILIYRKSFFKDVKAISVSSDKRKILTLLEHLKEVSSLKDVNGLKKLSGHKTAYRIRTGNYRLGLLEENGTLILVRILHRKEVYRYFP